MDQAEPLARTFRGKRIYGMDGFELHLPRTGDVLAQGFRGRWVSNYRQQYYPTMYTAFCIDVLSETIRDVRISELSNEHALTHPMIAGLEEGSICLYDRGLPSREKIALHKEAKNHFLFRLKTNSFKQAEQLLSLKIPQAGIFEEARRFYDSGLSLLQISQRLKRSKAFIRCTLIAGGVSLHPSTHSPEGKIARTQRRLAGAAPYGFTYLKGP